MPEVSEYAPGTFCWVELSTTDSEAAKRFYSSIFGWEPTDNPAGPDMVYTMLRKEGADVAALCRMDDARLSQGVPPHWMSYVSVASADEAAARARVLGATLLAEPFDVMEVGRMAIVQDPQGAMFCLWQPRQHIGARRLGEHGALCWNELATRDTAAAGEFYSGLFGWRRESVDMGMPYTMFHQGDRPAGGMMDLPAEQAQVPPHWDVYFAVDDCDAAVETARVQGGTVLMGPDDVPTVGRVAMLQDPQGAAFGVVKLLPAHGMTEQ